MAASSAQPTSETAIAWRECAIELDSGTEYWRDLDAKGELIVHLGAFL
jgi:hypothetical protein